MVEDPELERLRRLLTTALEKKPSHLKKILAALRARKPKYGRKSKKNSDKAA